VAGLGPNDLDVQAYLRFLVSGATECPIDGQGRILLPTFLREHAELEREVAIVGVGPRIEIWDKSLFDENQSRTQEDFKRIAAVVAGLER
jgi:MraZ protein